MKIYLAAAWSRQSEIRAVAAELNQLDGVQVENEGLFVTSTYYPPRPSLLAFNAAPLQRVLADPRYGKSAPHYGMPPGHLPVRSYLAIPVVSRSGDVIGGLFFGNPTNRTKYLHSSSMDQELFMPCRI